MNSALYARPNSVFPVTGVDLTGKRGYLLKAANGVHAVNDSLTVPAQLVVLNEETAALDSSVAALGKTPPIRLKAGGAIKFLDRIVQNNDGTVITDPGAGTARVLVGVCLEPAGAAAGDLFIADLWTPVIAA
jgi:hypothetical protein